MKKLLIILCLIFVPLNSIAGGTAEDLLNHCKGSGDQSYCLGYITGFYDGRTTSDYGKKELMSCPPAKTDGSGELAITYNQMRLVFIKWAENHPEQLHQGDWSAMRQAFAEAWPCQ